MKLQIQYIILIIFLFTINVVQGQNKVTLVYPKDNFNIENGNITCVWNKFAGVNVKYNIVVSEDSLFTSSIINQSGISTNKYSVAGLILGKKYFWRVTASVDGGATYLYTSTSDANILTYYTPKYSALSGNLQLWLRADSNSVVCNGADSLITEWLDLSGKNRHALQSNNSVRPKYIPKHTELGGKPAISFGKTGSNGSATYLSFPTITLSSAEYTVFVVYKLKSKKSVSAILSSPDINNSLYDGLVSAGGDLNNYFLHSAIGSIPGLTPKVTTSNVSPLSWGVNVFCNNQIFRNSLESSSYFYKNADSTIKLNMVGALTNINDITDKFFHGDISEIIIYNKKLSDTERLNIESYLYSRYAPPVNLGEDINMYGFCDTTLKDNSYFVSYKWSNNATTSSIKSKYKGGTYSLSAKDIFDHTTVDTINIAYTDVTFPASVKDTMLCYGSVLNWNTSLTQSAYKFKWQNNDTMSFQNIGTEGKFYVLVTDTTKFKCTYLSDTLYVSIDNFPSIATLGNDTSLCYNTVIKLKAGNDRVVSYKWNNNIALTDSLFTVKNNGNVIVEVNDVYNCKKIDTALIYIKGDLPKPNFGYNNVCAGNISLFYDSSKISKTFNPSDTILSFIWNFGDQNTANLRNPSHFYLDSGGLYNVKLITTSLVGCTDSIEKIVLVHDINSAFDYNITYLGDSTYFKDLTTVTTGDSVQSTLWNFGDGNTSSKRNPVNYYANKGTYNLSLDIVSSFACSKTLNAIVRIYDSIANIDKPTLVYPLKNSLVLIDTLNSPTITMMWNEKVDSNSLYQIEIATDSLFNNIVFSQKGITNPEVNFNYTSNVKYFWKIQAFNLTDFSIWSDAWSFVVTNQINKSNMFLWLRADTNIVTDASGNVSQWNDISGNAHNAEQTDATARPKYISNDNQPYLQFDGVNDMFKGDIITGINTASFSIIVSAYFEQVTNGQRGIFAINDYSNGFWMQRSNSESISTYNNGTVLGAVDTLTYKNKAIVYVKNKTNSNSKLFIDGNKLNENTTNGTSNFTNDNYYIGRTDKTHKGNISEIIILNKAITDNEVIDYSNYIKNKQKTSLNLGLNLGRDIYNYGFGDTVINAASGFVKYLWSTGDTTKSITVSTEGIYSLTVFNNSGFSAVDTINVFYPRVKQIKDTTVCIGDTLFWNTGLPKGYYSFLWQDGSSEEYYKIYKNGKYSVVITDINGYKFYSDTFTVNIDTLRTTADLGPNQSLCFNDELKLQKGSNLVNEYLWNDGTDNSFVKITSSDMYKLTMKSINQCIFVDSAYIKIKGAKPIPDFTFDTVCFGLPTSFFDQSSISKAFNPDDTITEFYWIFGNGQNSYLQNPSLTYNLSGTYDVVLSIRSDSGCKADITKQIIVVQKPEASFAHNKVFVGDSTLFTENTTTELEFPITSVYWDFGDEYTTTGKYINKLYDSSGVYNIAIIVSKEIGCADTLIEPVIIYNIKPTLTPPAMIAPQNTTVLPDKNVTFVWKEVLDTASTYELLLSSFSNFSDTILSNQNIADTTFSFILPTEKEYFWKVRCFNKSEYSNWSDTMSFSVFTPLALSNVELWLKADAENLSNGDKVYQWNDYSGKGNNALQTNNNYKPTYLKNQINGLPAIRFAADNATKYLNFNKISFNNSNYSFFIVYNLKNLTDFSGILSGYETPNDGGAIYAGGQLADYSNYGLTMGAFSKDNSIQADTSHFGWSIYSYLNDKLFKNSSEPKTYSLNPPAGSSGFFNTIGTMGNPTYINSYYFNGDIAEIIIYSSKLSPDDRGKIEHYLRAKYAPPAVYLGPDVKVDYNLCNYRIEAQPIYKEYLWANGSTNNYIDVDTSGSYSVTVTDFMGFKSSDQIYIELPTIKYPESNSICLYDTLNWITGLNNVYTFKWSDNTSDSLLKISNTGIYSITVTDTTSNKCTRSSKPFYIYVDDFSQIVSLGTDSVKCRGQKLFLEQGADRAVNYVWSDTSTEEYSMIFSEGIYSVTVKNNIGCIGIDSIEIKTIAGQIPIVSFLADTICLGNNTSFTNNSLINDTIYGNGFIDSFYWNFGDGFYDISTNPSHLYNNNGNYNVKLTAETNQGCSDSINKNIIVYENPIADFTNYPAFFAENVSFIDKSNAALGDNIISWKWFIGDSSYNKTNPNHIFWKIGYEKVTLIVNTKYKGTDTLIRLVPVYGGIGYLTPPKLIKPVDNLQIITGNLQDSLITFLWNEIVDTSTIYNVVFSKKKDFTDTIYNLILDKNTTQQFFNFKNGDTIYWKVRAFNKLEFSEWSEIRKIFLWKSDIFNSFKQNMTLWLRSDTLVETNKGRVVTWRDASGNNNNATQIDTLKQPTIFNHLCGYPAIKFDGTDDFLKGTYLKLDTSSFTIMMALGAKDIPLNKYIGLFAIDNGGTNGWEQGFWMHRSTNGTYGTGNGAITVYNKATAWGSISNLLKPGVFSNIISFTRKSKEKAGLFIDGTLINNTNLENLINSINGNYYYIGRTDGTYSGNMFEVILFNKVLTNEEMQFISQYLRNKYFNYDLKIGSNIYSESFCDLKIEPERKFPNYIWSTGETTPSINIAKNGTYSLTVQDNDNNRLIDEIFIQYPEFKQQQDTALCIGDSFLWNLNLDSSKYLFSWNTGSLLDNININKGGKYYVTIKNKLDNCLRTSDTVKILIDSFSIKATLGIDTTICRGNRIFLKQGKDGAASYVWNDNTNDDNLRIYDNGQYWVTVTDTLGCIKQDSVNITISGIAPTPDFFIDTSCVGISKTLLDLSTSAEGDDIKEWEWDFGDNSTSFLQNPLHQYDSTSTYKVRLLVTANSGCYDYIEKNYYIAPLPKLSITPNNACERVLVNLYYNCIDCIGGISSFEWIVNDTINYNNEFPTHSFTLEGNYDIQLNIKTNADCEVNAITNVTVREAPVVDFAFDKSACDGHNIAFSDKSYMLNDKAITIDKWSWNFGNGKTSSNQDITLYYDSISIYSVKLKVHATNGCEPEIIKQIGVNSKPIAKFIPKDVCEKTYNIFNDESKAINDSIILWKWTYYDSLTVFGQYSNLYFPDSGTTNITMTVKTEAGCIDSVKKTIIINPNPKSLFTFSPQYSAPPINVSFFNKTISADKYIWEIDENKESDKYEFSKLFNDTGTFNVKLIAQNNYGCKDSSEKILYVIKLIINILNKSLKYNIVDNFVNIEVEIYNAGNIPIEKIEIIAEIGNDKIVKEIWTGLLMPMQTIKYTFNSSIEIRDIQLLNFICVNLNIMESINNEIDISDNYKCINISQTEFILYKHYPNPTNDKFNIEFYMPNSQNINIILINSSGIVVKEFVNKIMKQGYYNVTANIQDIQSGMYYCKIIMNNKTEIFKIVKL